MDGNLSSAQKVQTGILPSPQQMLCLFLVLLGTFLCLERYLAAGISLKALIAAAGISAVMAEIMCHGRIQKITACLLFFLFCEIMLLRNQTLLAEGGKEIANQVIRLVNGHYRKEYLYWFVRQNGEGKTLAFFVLCVCTGFLEGFLVSFARGKKGKNAAFLSMPLLVFTAGILVGRTPSSTGMLLILAGFLALQLEPKVRGTWILGIGMGVVLVLAAFLAESEKVQRIMETYHAPWLQRQLEFEDRMLELVDQFSGIRLFSGNSLQKEYLLTNEKPNQTGKEIFQITTDKRPKQNVYIRGFIGGDYEGGSWKSASRQEFSDWAQKLGLSNQQCQQAVQNYPYRKLKELEKDGERTAWQVDMELKTSVPGYTLAPYDTEIPEHQAAVGDGSLAPGDRKHLQWDSFLFAESWQQEGFHTPGNRQKEAEGADKPEEEKIWESYGSYVQQVYTRLPEHGLEGLLNLTEKYDGKEFFQNQEEADSDILYGSIGNGKAVSEEMGEMQKKSQQVLELLWQNADYSQKLEPLPEGEDYAEYFLLKQKKGFCVHFATAGTLALRMYGVPARYVSGYVVFPEDFSPNSDGTFTAVVKDERGHAWTEIFQEETGFYPLELTPPAYFTALRELQPGENVDDVLEKWEEGEAEQEEEEEQEIKPPQEEESQEEKLEQPENNQKEEQLQAEESQTENDNLKKGTKTEKEGTLTIQKAGVGIGICLAGGVFLFLLFWRQRKRIKRRRQAEFSQENSSRGALAMGESMKTMLQSLGLEQKRGMSDSEYGAFLEQELPGMEWGKIVFLLQKAAFSEHGITKEECQAVAGAYQELEGKVHSLKQRKKENTT